MFLTRKEWIRIIIRNCVLFFLGILCYALALWSWMSGEKEVALPVCGAVAIFFGIIGFPLGRYAKGVSPLLMAARKTIYFELCPAKFIFLY